MILAVRLPFSTIPIIHAWWPSPYLGDFISAQNRAACSRGKQMSRPPGKERAEVTICMALGRGGLPVFPPELTYTEVMLHSGDKGSDLLVNSYHIQTLTSNTN